jgi:hypothetical protein
VPQCAGKVRQFGTMVLLSMALYARSKMGTPPGVRLGWWQPAAEVPCPARNCMTPSGPPTQ